MNELGGEHELARTSASIGAARDSEVWNPQLANVFRRRPRALTPVVRFAAAFVMTFVLAAGAIHYLTPHAATPAAAAVAYVPSSAAAASRTSPQRFVQQPQRRLMVYHNVVQMARAPLGIPDSTHATGPQNTTKAPEIAAVTVYPQVAPAGKSSAHVPVWRDPVWRTVSRMTTTSLSETAPQRVSSAESIQLGSPVRSMTNDAGPVGGETAINPQPPMIAYSEGAEGTTAFEVVIDERGTPTKCVITKPAGYRFLDDAVCKAAMKARYLPKTIDGRAVPGVYRDAFTFRVSTETSNGLPKAIP